MEQEDTHLAAQYLQDFDIGHLEDVPVKKEAVDIQRLPSMSLSCGGGVVAMGQSPPHHLLTPPGTQPEEYGVITMPSHHSMLIHQGGTLMYPDTPGTPPDTPPESNSPHSPPGRSYHIEHHPHPQNRGMVDDVLWIPQPQPLDLRPHCGPDLAEEWSSVKCALPINHTDGYHHHHHHHHHVGDEAPLSVARVPDGSSDSAGPDDIISDNELMGLSVRDLNKRLQGYPRETVVKLKQKRRTLKNRGYAHNCRSKRVHQRLELEMMNRELQGELHRIKNELARVNQELEVYKQERDYMKQERDVYKQRLREMDMLRKRERIQEAPAQEVYM